MKGFILKDIEKVYVLKIWFVFWPRFTEYILTLCTSEHSLVVSYAWDHLDPDVFRFYAAETEKYIHLFL